MSVPVFENGLLLLYTWNWLRGRGLLLCTRGGLLCRLLRRGLFDGNHRLLCGDGSLLNSVGLHLQRHGSLLKDGSEFLLEGCVLHGVRNRFLEWCDGLPNGCE